MRSATATATKNRLERLAAARLAWDVFADEALQLLARSLGFDAAVLAPTDRETGLIAGSVKRELPDDSYPWFARYEYVTPAPGTFAELARRADPVAVLFDETRGDPNRNPRYREFLAPRLAIAHEVRVAATEGKRLVGGLSLFRSAGSPAFAPGDVELLRDIAPTLAHGLSVRPVAPRAPTAERATLLVNGDGAIAARSADAADWLRILDPSGARPVPVPVVTAVTAARLHGSGEVRLAASVGWVRVRATVVDGGDPGIPSVVVDIEAVRGFEAARLSIGALGLTRREREVVELVLGGAATAEIARRLHLSPHTVQDHLKAVFRKSGVRSRRELVATLLR